MLDTAESGQPVVIRGHYRDAACASSENKNGSCRHKSRHSFQGLLVVVPGLGSGGGKRPPTRTRGGLARPSGNAWRPPCISRTRPRRGWASPPGSARIAGHANISPLFRMAAPAPEPAATAWRRDCAHCRRCTGFPTHTRFLDAAVGPSPLVRRHPLAEATASRADGAMGTLVGSAKGATSKRLRLVSPLRTSHPWRRRGFPSK